VLVWRKHANDVELVEEPPMAQKEERLIDLVMMASLTSVGEQAVIFLGLGQVSYVSILE